MAFVLPLAAEPVREPGAEKDANPFDRDAQDTSSPGKDNRSHLIHELRTPLNAILGFSDILQQELFGPLGDERYKRYAQIIHESGGRLLGLVNDLMDMSKLDAGKMDLHVRPFEVLRVIMESVREVETLAAKSHICIVMHVFDGVSTLVADDKRLHQMMLNMLSNAIKFTPERGEIDIDIYRRGGDIVIAVSDTGVGMREADIPTALEPFGQLNNQGGNTGTGLGLPLTKQFAELHGGTLELESTLGRGTTIRVALPELGKDHDVSDLGKTGAAALTA
jgi:signal transduction histidine kinase